jgi:hypothetical protein
MVRDGASAEVQSDLSRIHSVGSEMIAQQIFAQGEE